MVSRRLVGIDIGTSGLKVSVFDETGAVLRQSYREATYLPLPSGQKEQSPEQWRDDLFDALREAVCDSSGEIAAVGLCGLQHIPVFLDENLRPSRTVIQLHDQRLLESWEQLAESGALERIEALTKSMVSAAHFPPVFHFVATNDPAGLDRTRWILTAKDYLRLVLTGEIGAEICDATGMNLVEPNGSTWSKEICEILGVPIEALPGIPTRLTREGEGEARC